jgi:hypothetical protein
MERLKQLALTVITMLLLALVVGALLTLTGIQNENNHD